MKLTIKPDNKPRFTLYIPMFLIANSLVYKIINKYVKVEGLDNNYIIILLKALKKIRKTHKGLEIIRVEENNELKVSIKL
ncbi:MAG: hypothetical protein GX676_03800 [Bacilli bacterium]|nr:hypothetical protein [Bacilli bacterium]